MNLMGFAGQACAAASVGASASAAHATAFSSFFMSSLLVAILQSCLADHAGPLVVELPAGNEELHRGRVVTRAQAMLPVELVRGGEPGLVDLDAEAGTLRHVHHAA